MHTYTDVLEPIHSMKENVSRFKKYGTILSGTVECEGEEARIGKIDDQIYLVFYPDGTYDRFEEGPESVIYRDGWFGPDLSKVNLSPITLEEELRSLEKTIKPKLKSRNCKIEMYSSRVCLHGTKSCVVNHKPYQSTKKTPSKTPSKPSRKTSSKRKLS